METDSSNRQESREPGGGGKVQAWHQLRSWQRPRLAAAGIAAVAAAVTLVSLNGMTAGTGATWWTVGVAAAGSLLTGLLVGSFVRAPIGAEATVCDTRWPVFGLTGLVIGTSTGPASLAAQLFTGAAPAVLAGVIQPAFALLSFALLGWALRERLELERKVVAPSPEGDGGEVCTTCRPLFPARPGRQAGPSA